MLPVTKQVVEVVAHTVIVKNHSIAPVQEAVVNVAYARYADSVREGHTHTPSVHLQAEGNSFDGQCPTKCKKGACFWRGGKAKCLLLVLVLVEQQY